MGLNMVIERLANEPKTLSDNWTLPPEDAKLLYLLAVSAGSKCILEIGTSIGFSTLHLAQAAKVHGGMVTTIDVSAERQEQAKQNMKDAGLDGLVQFRLGSALPELEKLIQEKGTASFDFMFLDAHKAEYIDYFKAAKTLLKSNGLLFADNTQSHRREMEDFIVAIKADADWETADIGTSNGFILARKK